MNLAWSWPLAALSLLAAWLMASHYRAAWPVTLLVNVAGAAYFARTGQDGLVALEAAFTLVNVRGWYRWQPLAADAGRPTLDTLLDPYSREATR